jgi:hypothetical protein
MKAIIRILPIIALLAAFTACSKGEISGSGENTISLWSGEDGTGVLRTRAGDPTPNRSLQPLFLFWTSGNFNNTSAVAPDFFVKVPDGEINDFSVTQFNTNEYYPLNNKTVYACGIAPAPGEGYLEPVTAGSYTKFNIGVPDTGVDDDDCGVTDVMAAAVLSATDAAPFTQATPLNFKHLLTKLSFRARLADDMTKFVKYVKVLFPGNLAPLSLEWNTNEQQYEVTGGTTGTNDFLFGNYFTTEDAGLPRSNNTLYYQLSADRNQQMGYTHIVPPGSSINVHIIYKMADYIDSFDLKERMDAGETLTPEEIRKARTVVDVDREISIPFYESDGTTEVSLKAGDAYTINLVFNVYTIEMVGQKRDWEDGGYFYIPIQPTLVP